MRTLENQLEGLHEERVDQRRDRVVEEDQREDEVPERFGEQAIDPAIERRGVLVHAIAAIFERRSLTVSELRLPVQEASALECLQAAVSGRDVNSGSFVFAEERAKMLELALAVLQPNLAASDQIALAAGLLPQLTHHVATLRHDLAHLEDAQDDLIGEGTHVEKTLVPIDDASLDGPERPTKPKKSTLDGPAVAEGTKPKSTLEGPAIAEVQKKSTLDGPAIPEPAKPKSTLEGPAPAEPPKPPSSLGAEAGTEPRRR